MSDGAPHSFDLIEIDFILSSIVFFFASGVLWTVANTIYSLAIPNEIAHNDRIEDFLASYVAFGAEEDVTKEKLIDFKKDYWHQQETGNGKGVRFVIFIIQLFAVLAFSCAVLLFLQGILPFLLGSIQAFWLLLLQA